MLDRIWVDSFIIRAYIPRFTRPAEDRGGRKAKAEEKGSSRTAGRAEKGGDRRDRGGDILVATTTGPKNQKEALERTGKRDEEGGKVEEFSTTEEERSWLQGALTGRLRDDFLWKFHGEDKQNECVGKLKMTDLGDRMVLIRSETEKSPAEEMGGFGEWADFWMEWWHPWRSSDVNQRRLVWTKWTGVPLQAWTKRFFSWGCAKVGRVVEVHENTELRRTLDVAYVRIITGLCSLDWVMNCKVDGKSFNIRVEEMRSSEKVPQFQQCGDSDSEVESGFSGESENDDRESMKDCTCEWRPPAMVVEKSGKKGMVVSASPTHVGRAADPVTWEVEKMAGNNHGRQEPLSSRVPTEYVREVDPGLNSGIWAGSSAVGPKDRVGAKADGPTLDIIGGPMDKFSFLGMDNRGGVRRTSLLGGIDFYSGHIQEFNYSVSYSHTSNRGSNLASGTRVEKSGLPDQIYAKDGHHSEGNSEGIPGRATSQQEGSRNYITSLGRRDMSSERNEEIRDIDGREGMGERREVEV